MLQQKKIEINVSQKGVSTKDVLSVLSSETWKSVGQIIEEIAKKKGIKLDVQKIQKKVLEILNTEQEIEFTDREGFAEGDRGLFSFGEAKTVIMNLLGKTQKKDLLKFFRLKK